MRSIWTIASAGALSFTATFALAANIPVSDLAGLNAALASAASGDRILLSPGDYGALDFRHAHFFPAVTIEAADPASRPLFTSLYLNVVSGLVFSRLRIEYGSTQAPQTTYAINILDGADIDLAELEVLSAEDGVAGNDAYGVNIRDSARVTVRDSDIHDVYRGVSALESDDVVIRHSKIRNVGSDGFAGGGLVGLTVADNYFADFSIIDLEVQHPDAVQLWSRNASRANANVTITGNLIRRGGGDQSQGIFINTPEIATTGLLIADNVVEQTMAQGIFVQNGDGVIVRNNTVIPADYRTDNPGIEIRAPAANTSVSGNIAMAYRLSGGAAASGNITADYFNPWIADFIGVYLSDPAAPSAPGDFAPLTAAGAASFVSDLWSGDPAAPPGSLPPPPVIADLDFSIGIVDAAPDPVPVTLQTTSSGENYYMSDTSPKLTAALSVAIDARAMLPSSASVWRLLAAVPNSYDVRVNRNRIRFSVWTASGVTRLDGVNNALLDLAAHDIRTTYDGATGTMAVFLDGVQISTRVAPTGPVAYNPNQRLYVSGAPWGLNFEGGVERVKVTR
jgi:hypothetical protein